MDFPFFTEDEQPTMENFNKKFRALMNAGVKVSFGSYVGTGTSGQDAPNSLMFDFSPKIVSIPAYSYMPDEPGQNINYTYRNEHMIWLLRTDAITTEYRDTRGFGIVTGTTSTVHPKGKISPDGKTIYWYHTAKTAGSQFNASGTTYYYFAIG